MISKGELEQQVEEGGRREQLCWEAWVHHGGQVVVQPMAALVPHGQRRNSLPHGELPEGLGPPLARLGR
jgi:hypothetical protein